MSDGNRINMDDVQRSMATQRDRAAMSEAAKASIEDLYKQAAEARDAMDKTLVRLENENEHLRDALELMAMLGVRDEQLLNVLSDPAADPRDVDAASELAAEADEAMYDNEVARAAYERAKRATKPDAGKE